MIIDLKDEAAFAGYEKALTQLQSAFIFAGLVVSFNCIIDPVYGKTIEIFKDNKNRSNYVCIEGDSPAQAIKNVAAGVKL